MLTRTAVPLLVQSTDFEDVSLARLSHYYFVQQPGVRARNPSAAFSSHFFCCSGHVLSFPREEKAAVEEQLAQERSEAKLLAGQKG